MKKSAMLLVIISLSLGCATVSKKSKHLSQPKPCIIVFIEVEESGDNVSFESAKRNGVESYWFAVGNAIFYHNSFVEETSDYGLVIEPSSEINSFIVWYSFGQEVYRWDVQFIPKPKFAAILSFCEGDARVLSGLVKVKEVRDRDPGVVRYPNTPF